MHFGARLPALHVFNGKTSCDQAELQGTSLTRNSPLHHDHHRALGIILLQGLRGARFLMSEVPLYRVTSLIRIKLSLRPHSRPFP